MWKFYLIFAVIAILQPSVHGAPGGKVVGGTPAATGAFPYMVSLQRTSHTCGGSILTRRSILTAAHCLSFSAEAYSVYVGSNTLNAGGVRYQVASYINHPEYESDGDTASNDVGVVYLTEDLEFSSLVAPIELETDYIVGGLNVNFTGWGVTSYPGSVPNELQYISLLSIDEDECASRFSGLYPTDDTQICTWTTTGEGICFGDSGSPLVRDGKQIGIASWVEPCAVGYPDVYARISVLTDWINSVTV